MSIDDKPIVWHDPTLDPYKGNSKLPLLRGQLQTANMLKIENIETRKENVAALVVMVILCHQFN